MADNKRIDFFLKIILFLFLLILLRLFYVQVIRHSFYEEISQDQRTREIVLAADRGDIYDRNGSLLATSIDTYSVFVRPRAIKEDKGYISKSLVKIFPSESKEISEKFSEDRPFWLKRKIDKALMRKVASIECTAIDIFPDKKRIYPKGRLAAQLIGFVGQDNDGQYGIEYGMNGELKGREGKFIIEKDPKGREIATASSRMVQSPAPGKDVYLTIDEAIQYNLEQELAKAIKQYTPLAASAMIMDIKTGEILAVTGWPDFDPNDHKKTPQKFLKLSPITDIYEPGSTFKTILASAALDSGVITMDTIIPCPPSIKVGGIVVANSHTPKYNGPRNIRDVLAESLNTGTSFVGVKLGAQKYYKYIDAFGFGNRSGIDFPGEPYGILKSPENWSKSDCATVSFGQSVSVTPIQLLCAVAAIANGGVRIKPQLVSRVESTDKEIVRSSAPQTLNRVISETTAKNVTEIMKGDVYSQRGTGHLAKMKQFSCAGKTGTGQKVINGRYDKQHFIASFVGFAPVSNPRLACLVILDEPKGSHWGETTSAPVFGRAMNFALRYLNVAPDL